MKPEEPPSPDEYGTDTEVPTATPDDTLVVEDGELILPDYLVGYIGQFTIRTPSVTGEMETTEHGPGETSGVLGAVPEGGDHHADLEAGMMAIETEEHPEKVFRIEEGDSNEA
jgi:hypothetical protein